MAENKPSSSEGKVEHADPNAEPPAVKGAHRAADHKATRGGRTDGAIVTGDLKREADKSSSPVPNDAQLEDPPVRTARPDVPIAVSSAVGAGQHVPPDPEKYTPEGRPRGLPGRPDNE
jgi:hypothetical protein